MTTLGDLALSFLCASQKTPEDRALYISTTAINHFSLGMATRAQNSDLHGYAQKTSIIVCRKHQITIKHGSSSLDYVGPISHCALQKSFSFFPHGQCRKQSRTSANVPHETSTKLSLACPLPSRIPKLTFSNHSAENLVLYPMFSRCDLCIKSKYSLNSWPQDSAKDSPTENLPIYVMIFKKF